MVYRELSLFRYTAEGIKGVLKGGFAKREEEVRELVEKSGEAKLVEFKFISGDPEWNGMCIIEYEQRPAGARTIAGDYMARSTDIIETQKMFDLVEPEAVDEIVLRARKRYKEEKARAAEMAEKEKKSSPSEAADPPAKST